jgi:hypothetical protein
MPSLANLRRVSEGGVLVPTSVVEFPNLVWCTPEFPGGGAFSVRFPIPLLDLVLVDGGSGGVGQPHG